MSPQIQCVWFLDGLFRRIGMMAGRIRRLKVSGEIATHAAIAVKTGTKLNFMTGHVCKLEDTEVLGVEIENWTC
jgi:hypothetical protein